MCKCIRRILNFILPSKIIFISMLSIRSDFQRLSIFIEYCITTVKIRTVYIFLCVRYIESDLCGCGCGWRFCVTFVFHQSVILHSVHLVIAILIMIISTNMNNNCNTRKCRMCHSCNEYISIKQGAINNKGWSLEFVLF